MITVNSRRNYSCRGRRDSFTFTKWGVVTLTVISPKPQPVLSVSPSWPNPGASVTLNCEGLELQSAGWRFFWYKTVPDLSKRNYRPSYTYELLPGSTNGTEQNSFIINGPTLTAGFVCRAGRGEPKFYTHYSEVKFVWSADSAAASLSVNPDRVQHFRSESVTLTCKGNSTEWRVMKSTERDHLSFCSNWGKMTGSTCTINMNWSPSGVFWCESGSGEFSNAVNITIHAPKPQPVLSVSPSWPNPGASVTLNCEGLELQSAGWRFFWYKTVPDTSKRNYRPSYTYELLPGSTNGTEQNSFIINGPTLTAGFVCRAGRGEPKFYTNYSEVKFVWSADSHPAASLSVSPDRVQHFVDQSVTMKCGENDTKWRLRRFTESTSPSHVRCSNWGTMHGSSCTIDRLEDHSGVYWCESESGKFSNSVNITVQDDYDDIILVSPVHPVTEGDPVTLSCRDKKQNLLSNVFFYHNDKLIQNDSREELKISAVSKSDEGFYKCQHSGKESPSSWMSVRVTLSSPVSSSRLLLIIGPISGIILIIFLLLLWRYRRPKDLCSFRSDKNNQRSTTNHRAEIEISDNNAPSEGDALYASVKPSEAAAPAEPKEITYTMIKFKKLRKKRKPRKPEERVVYAEVKPRAAELAPTYAVVNKSKAKKNRKGKPAATNEPVYSEIKSGATLNDESAL
ncbi:basement membrane-specific heparan sulfate proteoglycan core protein-like [Gambusia affinis]|uniref:basement membrane-specific heparan sulfate proteoglycan core protein-like n=1 Tax=Gambusia affinis TaxID=33528 RepID=UPI001CDD79EE|nr:basement membrane-specific heparan sulfate proteoglycan core protein-like [Gambusia affinis]